MPVITERLPAYALGFRIGAKANKVEISELDCAESFTKGRLDPIRGCPQTQFYGWDKRTDVCREEANA
jgi:hypothetical protein